MPAAAYSQYKDSNTGETIWIPQLFPHAKSTGEISSKELENWLNTGLIPRDLYDSDVHNRQEMEEIRKRVQKGEQVEISSLPHNLGALTEYLLKNKSIYYQENVLAKIFSALHHDDPDIVWLSFVKEALTNLASIDPLVIHFHIARKTLKNKYNIEDSKAIDILTRELVEHCKRILNFKSFSHPAFQKNPIEPKDLNDHLSIEKGLLQIDAEFIQHLKNIGSKGRKLSNIIKETSISIFSTYKDKNYSNEVRRQVWGLWITKPHETISPFLSALAQALWEDQCLRLWNRKTNSHPSLPKPILDRIIPILNPKKNNKFVEKEGQIICYNQRGEPLLMAPAVDVNMISAFQKGIKELGTLTGHKLLRWQVNTGFEKWQNGNKDPRLIEIDGGYTRIAELAECHSPKEISKIREILCAQAYSNFIFPDGSYGNMISLRIEDRYRNQEPSKIRIVLGDMLLPAYVCQLQRSDRRLIPIGPLPPLHGSPNSHACQAQLQLHVFSEFSNQSDRLAEQGSVFIPLEKWKQMAAESGLNPEKIDSIIIHWCQPDFFNCFLEKHGDEFRLASYYNKAQKFLEIQGKGRITNSERGKRSVEKRRRNTK